MFKLGTAVGLTVGYLAANEQARHRLWSAAKDAWNSPRAQAVEQKVAATLPSLADRLPGSSTSAQSTSTSDRTTSSMQSTGT